MYFVDCELAEYVCQEIKIDRSMLTKFSSQIDEERKDEVQEMRRIRQLYNNKKGDDFEFTSFSSFYKWYVGQHRKQSGCCYYCKTSEKVISELFVKKFLLNKRPNRGMHLEVERRDSKSNKYNEDNCVLACYFCNNDKSSIFSEGEYFEYLKDRKSFFEKQLDSK